MLLSPFNSVRRKGPQLKGRHQHVDAVSGLKGLRAVVGLAVVFDAERYGLVVAGLLAACEVPLQDMVGLYRPVASVGMGGALMPANPSKVGLRTNAARCIHPHFWALSTVWQHWLRAPSSVQSGLR